jgi:cell division protein FtsW
MVFGCLAIFSSVAFFAESSGQSAGTFVVKHVVKLGMALILIILLSKVNYSVLARFSPLFLIASLCTIVAMLLFGEGAWGATRALDLGFITFQPIAFAGVALILRVAVLIHEKQEYIKSFSRAFLPIMFWITVTCGLIAIEDFSSAAVIMTITMIMMFVGRISLPQLSTLVLVGLIGGSAFVMSSPERQSRITSYVTQISEVNNVRLDQNDGYQAQQAHIAIAQGEFFGVGIGKSTQRDFLPAPYNDFIFAIIAEEYGLAGASFVLAMFTLIIIRGIAIIARHAPDVLGTMLALGATLFLTIYALVNACVATGLFPVTGLPMPFISYGGTSIIFAAIMTGILLNISKYNTNLKARFYNE